MSAVLKLRADETRQNRFSISIEAGQEEMWLTLRDMTRSGFTAQMLAQASGAKTSKAEFYLAQLSRIGIAQKLGQATDGQLLYSVSRVAPLPEVLNDQGQPDADYRLRHVLWAYVRRHKMFTATALWVFAQEHVVVEKKKVIKFIKRLVVAEYLYQLDLQLGEAEQHYSTHPVRCSGALPPRFCEADLIYDVNTRSFHGKAMAKAVAL
jgi:hypothetical protein